MVFIIESGFLLVRDGYFLQHLIWQQQTHEDKNCYNRSNGSLTHNSFSCLLLILLCADEKADFVTHLLIISLCILLQGLKIMLLLQFLGEIG